jgi:hypothetical protein
MKKSTWYSLMFILLALGSLAIYIIQIQVFKQPQDTFFYLFQDLAFVPLQVLLVTLVLNELLKKRENQTRKKHTQMSIGVFYSEMGIELLQLLKRCDSNIEDICVYFEKKHPETTAEYLRIGSMITNRTTTIQTSGDQLLHIAELTRNKRSFLLNLLENSNLMEHESFTDLLWSITHLSEELAMRKDLKKITPHDRDHLNNDIQRVYHQLLKEWIIYFSYLKDNYPFIYSFYKRNNPYNRQSKISFN